MNHETHSVATLGTILMVIGMCAILFVPYYLRSTLNKDVGIPESEKRLPFSLRFAGRILLLLFLCVSTTLSLARIYSVPSLWLILAFALFIALSVGGRREPRGRGGPRP